MQSFIKDAFHYTLYVYMQFTKNLGILSGKNYCRPTSTLSTKPSPGDQLHRAAKQKILLYRKLICLKQNLAEKLL